MSNSRRQALRRAAAGPKQSTKADTDKPSKEKKLKQAGTSSIIKKVDAPSSELPKMSGRSKSSILTEIKKTVKVNKSKE